MTLDLSDDHVTTGRERESSARMINGMTEKRKKNVGTFHTCCSHIDVSRTINSNCCLRKTSMIHSTRHTFFIVCTHLIAVLTLFAIYQWLQDLQ